MFLIYILSNITLFGITVFLDILAAELVICLQRGCGLYKSWRQAGFIRRGHESLRVSLKKKNQKKPKKKIYIYIYILGSA